MDLQTALAQVRRLGLVESVLNHWWLQRITAVALIPLILWFAWSLATFTSFDFQGVVAWIRSPIRVWLLLLFVAALLYHALLGIEVVIDDYVDTEPVRNTSLFTVQLILLLLGLTAMLAVVKIALFGAN